MKYKIVILALVVVGCTQQTVRPTQSLGIHTSVSGRNVNDIARDVQEWHDVQNPKCTYKKVVAAEVVKRESGSVIEHWTIEACNHKLFTYEVSIIPGRGGITDAVSNVDESPAKYNEP